MAEEQTSLSDLSLGQFTAALMRELQMAENPTPVQMQILQYLETGPKRRVIAAFRGCGKSSLSAIYILWRLVKNPELKVLVVSASLSRAEALTAWLLKTIGDVSWLSHLLPNSHDGRYSRISFDVGTCRHIEQSPSVRAAGVSGQVTGSRADIILCDDVETVQTSLTQTQREKLRNVLNEFEVILKPNSESEIVYLGTPHSSTDSIYFALHRELNYAMRMWPSRVPADLTPYKNCLAPLIEKRHEEGGQVGRPTDTRFGADELLQRELSMSVMQNKLQMMLDATLTDLERYPLRCANLMVIDVDQYLPEIMVYEKHKSFALDDLACAGMAHDPTFYRPREQQGLIGVNEVPTVLCLDPSAGGADEFAYAVMKVWGGNYYLIACGGHLGGVSDEFWKKMAMLAKEHGVNEIVVESNFGGISIYEQILKPYLRNIGAECRVEGIRSNQQKELRIIDTLAPVMQTHRFAIARSVIEQDMEVVKNAKDDRDVSYSLIHQMTRLTHDRGSLLHDDRLDAVSMAVQWFTEQAALDQKQRARDRSKELLLASVEDSNGWALMSVQRQAMGMTLEQCQQAESGSQGSWI